MAVAPVVSIPAVMPLKPLTVLVIKMEVPATVVITIAIVVVVAIVMVVAIVVVVAIVSMITMVLRESCTGAQRKSEHRN